MAKSRLRKRIFIVFIPLVSVSCISIWLWLNSLADVGSLKESDPGIFITVKGADGRQREFAVGMKNPSWTPLDATSGHLVNAVIASEDDAFFQHEGFNMEEMKNAIKADIKKRRFARGASTITMQLAKNLYLTKEKTLTRKLKEAYITYRLESALPKERILELYLNVIEWGPGVYGIGEASRFYYGKHPSDLDLSEAAMLAVILPSPRRLNPYVKPDSVEKRRAYLLKRMLLEHDINEMEYARAISSPAELLRTTLIKPQAASGF